LISGEALQGLLREQEPSLYAHLKDAARPLYQLRFNPIKGAL
jgi:hypothetical protein